ncbi:MAG TPA: hypothetical protein VEI96_03570 [Thermodesulfovibrionales bacterium]|nr:hypothetical protein [Thermodesulfovibrionales bacterium]
MKASQSFVGVNNVGALLLSAIFLILLWMPTLDSFFSLDKAPWINENRAPAKFPEVMLSMESLRALPAGLEAYFGDRFGFRKRLIRCEQKWKHELFRESNHPAVLIGRDGWLYYTGEQMLEHFQGAMTFTRKELAGWQALLEKRRDWLARRGIRYLLVIVPDKQTIYPEHVPDWLTRTEHQTKLDQLLAHLKANTTIEVLDLRPALREAKKTARTYLYTDTHWNMYGAFVAYQALIQALSRQLRDLGEPLPYAAFEPSLSQEKGGDLAGLLGGQSMTERDVVRLRPRAPLQLSEIKADPNIFVKRPSPYTPPVYTENPTGKYILLSFRDSFSDSWIGLLGHHFKRAVYIWQYNWNGQIIARERPDVVVDEIVERFFNIADTKKLMRDDGLS